MKKRITCLLLMLALIVSSIAAPNHTKYAKADNRTMGSATPIEIGGSATDNFNKESDEVHYFKITIPEDIGNQWIKFSYTSYSDGDTCMALCDAQGTVIRDGWFDEQTSGYYIAKPVGSGTLLDSDHIITAGNTYYIKIYTRWGYRLSGSFDVSVAAIPDDNWGTYEQADQISVNQRKTGTLERTDDIDMFSVVLPKDGKKYAFAITADNDIRAIFSDSDRIKLSETTVAKNTTNTSYSATGKGQEIYIRIESGSTNTTYMANYSIKVITQKQTISTLTLSKYNRGSKKIVGQTIGNATIKVTVSKKTYTAKSNSKGKFTVKVSKKLKYKDKIKVAVSKTNYKTLKKTFPVM